MVQISSGVVALIMMKPAAEVVVGLTPREDEYGELTVVGSHDT